MPEMGSRFLLGVALMATACGASDEPSVDASRTESTAATATSAPSTDSELSTSTSAAGAGRADGYRPPPGWEVWQQLRPADAMLNRDGVSLEIPLTGGPPGEPTNPCVRNYELTVNETNTEVRIALFELRPSAPDTGGSEEYACADVGHSWRLTATLEQPLGDRPFINDTTGLPEAVTDLATILEPTYVPSGWEPRPINLYSGQLERGYLNPSSGETIIVSSVPLGGGSNLDAQRDAFEGDPVRFEDITIRSTNGLKITFLEGGGVTIAWEEGQRLYQVQGSPGVDPSELTAIAESMQ